MACEVCGVVNGHDTRCPYYVEPKVDHYCSICKSGIVDGEEFIMNNQGEYIHYECIPNVKWLLKWLGYDILEMNDEY